MPVDVYKRQEESKKIWEENAQFWDNAMGDESNEFHREVVRPKVTLTADLPQGALAVAVWKTAATDSENKTDTAAEQSEA